MIITPQHLIETNENDLISPLKGEFQEELTLQCSRAVVAVRALGSAVRSVTCRPLSLCGVVWLTPCGQNLTTQPGHNLKQARVFK